MKAEILHNGATATITRVFVDRGEKRWQFIVDIKKEKRRCRVRSIREGATEMGEFIFSFMPADIGNLLVDDDEPITHLAIIAEDSEEKQIFRDWMFSEDTDRHQYRFWLVKRFDEAEWKSNPWRKQCLLDNRPVRG